MKKWNIMSENAAEINGFYQSPFHVLYALARICFYWVSCDCLCVKVSVYYYACRSVSSVWFLQSAMGLIVNYVIIVG